jgi:lipopolysaccharide/colanic/teichoic acid biosynthesis glycosyltransferase
VTGPYRGKRLLDVAILAVAAIPAALLGLLAAVAIKLTSRGPVFFRQTRIGMGGDPFEVVKFRTMLAGPNPLIPDDSRITSAGRVLRRFSIDELPQLLNVAHSEMSIVGPRPALPQQAELYDALQRQRLAVRPGLTGWAQVNGRNAIPWAERITLDLEYVERQSARFDFHILRRTAGVMLGGEGVEGHPTDDPMVGT